MSAGRPVVLASMSAAMDGGFTAIADVSQAMEATGAADDYRLIGGVTVMLHVQRLGLDLPLRATGDADFGVPPSVLRRPELAEALEELRGLLARELGSRGWSLSVLTEGLQDDAAARLRTRLRALLAEVVGIPA